MQIAFWLDKGASSYTGSGWYIDDVKICSRSGDIDGDCMPDTSDNCSETFNAGQQDTNYPQDDNSNEPGDQHYGNACDGDLDNDGFVGPNDFNIFGARWYTGPP